MGKVILVCGKIGSGKTTYASKLAKQLNAVNISQDELMLSLFGAELYYNEPEKYNKYCSRVEDYVKYKAGEVAKAGATAICENGFWSRSERDALRSLYKDMGVECELHYIDTSEDQRIQNIRCRNEEIQQGKSHFFFTDEKDICHFFESPTETEITLRVKWEELIKDSEHEPIKVRRHGTTGPVVTVLHGGPGAPGCAVGLAKALAPYFIVNEPLQRRSGKFPLTVASHVKDLAQIAPQNAILIGHSWGAMLALSFAATHPDRVAKIILVGCGTYDENSRALMKRRLGEMMNEGTQLQIDDLRRLLNEESDPIMRDTIWRELGELYMKVETYDPILDLDYLHEEVAMDSIGNKETWEDVLRLQREGVEPERFSKISCPVIMLHGAHDPHPGKETAELLRGFIPQLEYIEFEKCGHEPWRERLCHKIFLAELRNKLA